MRRTGRDSPGYLKAAGYLTVYAYMSLRWTFARLGELPLDWKLAAVVAAHNGVSRMQAENYRPAGLMCIICKRLKGLMREHVHRHLIKYRLW